MAVRKKRNGSASRRSAPLKKKEKPSLIERGIEALVGPSPGTI
jgi:hypothetical protein